MRRWVFVLLGIVAVEFFVAPFGGRVFDYFFPEEHGFTGMIPDIPFYQWGYASILAFGFVLGIAFARWQAARAPNTLEANTSSPAADADLLTLELFVSRSVFPAIDRLDGLIDEATGSAIANDDIAGVLLRYYLAAAMARHRDRAQSTLRRKTSGKTVNINVLEEALCEAIETYRSTSNATHKAMAASDPSTTFGHLYRRWKQADDDVDRGLSELLGALPDNSPLRMRLRLIRSRFSHLA